MAHFSENIVVVDIKPTTFRQQAEAIQGEMVTPLTLARILALIEDIRLCKIARNLGYYEPDEAEALAMLHAMASQCYQHIR